MRCTITGLLMLITCSVFGGEYRTIAGDDKPIKKTTGGDHQIKIYVSRTANLKNIKLDHAVLKGADLKRNDLGKSDLSGSDLSGANLSKAKFAYATLHNVNLSKAILENASFFDADLSGANLQDIENMKYCSFFGSNLTGASFSGSNLTGASFSGEDFTATGWKSANWKGAYFYSPSPPRWPRGFPNPKTLGIVEKPRPR